MSSVCFLLLFLLKVHYHMILFVVSWWIITIKLNFPYSLIHPYMQFCLYLLKEMSTELSCRFFSWAFSSSSMYLRLTLLSMWPPPCVYFAQTPSDLSGTSSQWNSASSVIDLPSQHACTQGLTSWTLKGHWHALELEKKALQVLCRCGRMGYIQMQLRFLSTRNSDLL